MSILDKIVKDKKQELAGLKKAVPADALREKLVGRSPVRDFHAALAAPGIGVIAEAKKASPSKGLLCPDFDPVQLARTYAEAGAAAISVLTESRYFQGSLDYISQVKHAVELPVLRKDFIFDAYQVYESAAAGADAILLIVSILSDEQLSELYKITTSLGLACLVEAHDEVEVRRAVAAGVRIIGINNRDLATFRVDIAATVRLRPMIPAGTLVVSESGIRTREDVRRLAEIGVDAVLIGETLVTADDVAGTLRGLLA